MERALRVAITLASVASSVLLFESGLRWLRHPMDYLKPRLAPHPILGFRVEPGTGGHDAWGFRNHAVPDRAEVVAIGDSQTWGVAARGDESWPAWLARSTGRSTYNLALAGYGPAEYLHLQDEKAFSLDPDWIVVGLYFGNDFIDAYDSVAHRDHWASLRSPSMAAFVAGGTNAVHTLSPLWVPDEPSLIWRARRWLRQHSMLFRVVESGPVGQLVNAWGDQRADFSGERCSLEIEEPFSTVLQPENRYRGLDPHDPAIPDGIDLALGMLSTMAERAAARGIDFLVVLIPTKESVLLDFGEAGSEGCERIAQRILESESTIRARVRDALAARRIRFVDPLDAMRSASRRERTYLRSADSHPNGRGYRVIAEAVAASMGHAR